MSKWEQPIYIGRDSISGSGLAICKVLDSDIETGEATVFNRETKKVEKLSYLEKKVLPKNIKKLAVDTQEFDCGY